MSEEKFNWYFNEAGHSNVEDWQLLLFDEFTDFNS
jgi:hypothetical protein